MKTIYIKYGKIFGILFIGMLLGWLLFGGNSKNENHQQTQEATNTIWTCSMDPQIKQQEPGQCPLCGMDLIPLTQDTSDDPSIITMSENAVKLANIQTVTVGEGLVSKEIRLNGKVQFDERRTKTQTSHVPGRIEHLKINFTGETVNRGQTIAIVYSPELITAQEELLQASTIKNTQPTLFEAAKQKLRNWKISETTISKIISSGKPIQQFPIIADVSGIVLTKNVSIGDYVERGMPLFEIADIQNLWILFDVYESDLNWVKVGNTIKYTVQSLPGETFNGKISFLDPVINPQTRVATARVELSNSNKKLKPEMFVTGTIYPTEATTASKEIVVPKSAVLWTGERSIVYIKHSKSNKFELREVILGTSTGENYVIKEGLDPGEEIVVNGAFTVDAASQLAGKPSMMNLQGGVKMTGHANHGKNETNSNAKEDHSQHENGNTEISAQKNVDHSNMSNKAAAPKEFQQQLEQVFNSYNNLKNGLTQDNVQMVQKSASQLLLNLNKVNMKLVSGESHAHWMTLSKELGNSAKSIAESKDIEIQRKHFIHLSTHLTNAIKLFGINKKVFVQFCPMANDNKGANWLSLEEVIKNPYYGKKMIKCGNTTEIIK